jgi:succinyl-diaminopimelate desuccinylase
MNESTRALLIQAIQSRQDEMSHFLEQLISIPTENPPGRSYLPCVSLLERKCREVGLETKIIDVPSGGDYESCPRQCLLAFLGEADRILYFHGHYDVVPASDPRQFLALRKGTKLFGRGASDMKGGLVAMIYAARALKECGIKLNGKIGLTIVPDEETGGRNGSQYLEQIGLLGKNGIGMLTPEPTSGVIWNANRGAISLRVRVGGKSAHVGLHFLGKNAFEHMHQVVTQLLCFKEEVMKKKTCFQIKPEAAKSSILLLGGQCEGGTSFNSVPGECSFTIDRRINPEEDFDGERLKLMEILERLKSSGVPLELEVLQEGSSAGFSEDEPLARSLAESVHSIVGKPSRFEMCPGLLEIRFYGRRNVPAFAYGPGLLSVSHGPNEYVDLRDVYRCAAIYALTALRSLGAV